jgi:hypothetical protein
MSFRHEACNGTDASRSVMRSDVRGSRQWLAIISRVVIGWNKNNCDWSAIGSTCDTIHIGSCASLLRACDVMQEARVVIRRAFGLGDVLVHHAVFAETKKERSEVTKKQVKCSSVCVIFICAEQDGVQGFTLVCAARFATWLLLSVGSLWVRVRNASPSPPAWLVPIDREMTRWRTRISRYANYNIHTCEAYWTTFATSNTDQTLFRERLVVR